MEVEEFTKRTKKWKRKWKRDRSLDAGKKHGLWGIGDRGRTCPVPSPANGRFTGSHLLLGPAVPAPTVCLHPWWYQGTGLFAAVLGEPKGRHSPEHSLSFPSSLELGKILPSQEKLGKLDKILSSRLASSPSLTSPTHIDHLHVGCPCHPAAHRRRDAMLQIDDSRGKLGDAAPRPSSAGPSVRILSHSQQHTHP